MQSGMTIIDKGRFGPWAVVTGASSGIGKEFARQLAASGINVVLVARRLAVLEEVGRWLAGEYGVEYRVVAADLAEDGFLERLGDATRDLDVGLLVSNAGDGSPGEFLSIERGELLRIVRLNVIAHLNLAHHFGRRLAKRGRGGMLLVTAFGARQGLPYMSNDGATKAYVLVLGEGLSFELRKAGVNVTVLLPGPTDTPILARHGLDAVSAPTRRMSAEQCVAEGLAALKANRATHIAGRTNRILARLLPGSVITKLFGNMLGKVVAAEASRPDPS